MCLQDGGGGGGGDGDGWGWERTARNVFPNLIFMGIFYICQSEYGQSLFKKLFDGAWGCDLPMPLMPSACVRACARAYVFVYVLCVREKERGGREREVIYR